MSVDALNINDFIDNNTLPAALKLFSNFAYDGFTPDTTFKELKARAVKAGMTGKQLIENVIIILYWFVARGAKWAVSTSALRTKAEGKKIIKEICEKLGIINTKPVNSSDINIARLVAVFAVQVAKIYQQFPNNARKIVDPTGYGLPAWCCFPQAASIITKDQLSAFTLWATEFDRVINPNKPTETPRLAAYISAAFNSPLIPMDKRKTMQEEIEAAGRL